MVGIQGDPNIFLIIPYGGYYWVGGRQVEMFKASAKKSVLEGPSIQITGSGFQILHSTLCLVPHPYILSFRPLSFGQFKIYLVQGFL